MASWGYCLEPMEKLAIHILLELKTLHKGNWEVDTIMAFSQQLNMQVMPELYTLLKLTSKVYPELYAIFADIHNTSPLGLWGAHLPHLRSKTF